MSEKLNTATAVIGIDIGKNSFHIVGQDRRGAIVLRQKWFTRPGWKHGSPTCRRAAARLLQVAPKTLRIAAEAGEIEALHPLPDGPWIFSRAVLSTAPARAITERARQNPRHPRDRIPISKTCSLQ
jgi:hypothetical protein